MPVNIEALEKMNIKDGETVIFRCVLTPQTRDIAVRFARYCAERGAWFVCLPPDIEIEKLSDSDLKKLGLERVSDPKKRALDPQVDLPPSDEAPRRLR
jgi:hypothetical protein